MRMYATSQLARTLSALLAGRPAPAERPRGGRGLDRQPGHGRGRRRRDATRSARGKSLTTALESTGMVDNLTLEMVKVGEQTGALADMLNAVADFYDEELDDAHGHGARPGGAHACWCSWPSSWRGMLLAFYLPLFQAISGDRAARSEPWRARRDPRRRSRRRRAAEEEAAARALAARYGLEYVDVASFAPDPEILQSVPVELMFRYNFLPYRREDGRLVLVMADPTDIPVVDELTPAAADRRSSPRWARPPPSRRR